MRLVWGLYLSPVAHFAMETFNCKCNWTDLNGCRGKKNVKMFLNFLRAHSEGLRQSLTTESPLKMMKNAFYFTLKAPFRSQDI